jgi:hypothetical protein
LRFESSLGKKKKKKVRPYLRNTQHTKNGVMGWLVVDCLPSNLEVLSSNSSISERGGGAIRYAEAGGSVTPFTESRCCFIAVLALELVPPLSEFYVSRTAAAYLYCPVTALYPPLVLS